MPQKPFKPHLTAGNSGRGNGSWESIFRSYETPWPIQIPNAQKSHAIKALIRMWLRRCCSGGLWETQWDYIFHHYEAPRPFAGLPSGAAGTWVPPELGRPAWCDKLAGINVKFGKLANHPCAYWTANYGPVANRTRGF